MSLIYKFLTLVNILKRHRLLRDLHDIEIINENSERLNQEAQENIDFQNL